MFKNVNSLRVCEQLAFLDSVFSKVRCSIHPKRTHTKLEPDFSCRIVSRRSASLLVSFYRDVCMTRTMTVRLTSTSSSLLFNKALFWTYHSAKAISNLTSSVSSSVVESKICMLLLSGHHDASSALEAHTVQPHTCTCSTTSAATAPPLQG